MKGRPQRNEDTRNYQEAISQWQLAARTEVKKSSSLPSSMFDTHDPMLEACLADSVDRMMHCLHQPETTAADQTEPQDSDLRVETVTQEELQQLPRSFSTAPDDIDLEAGMSAEYLSLLIDSCTTGDAPTQAAARELLQRDFSVAAKSALHDATQAVFACLQRVTNTEAEAHERMAELCSAIAASVIVDDDVAQESDAVDDRKPPEGNAS